MRKVTYLSGSMSSAIILKAASANRFCSSCVADAATTELGLELELRG